jgi:hypothetical protein
MLGDGNDTITIKANDANDYLVIDGGDGEDKVVIDGKFGEYTLSQNAQGNLVVKGSNGDTYELRNIENIEFSDGSYNTTDGVFNDTTVSAATLDMNLSDATALTEKVTVVDTEANDTNGIYEKDGNYYTTQTQEVASSEIDVAALREKGYTTDGKGNFYKINEDAPKVLVEQKLTREVTKVVDAKPSMIEATKTTTFMSVGEEHVDEGSEIAKGATVTYTFAESTSNVELNFNSFDSGSATIKFIDANGNQIGNSISQSATNGSAGYSVPEGAVGMSMTNNSSGRNVAFEVETISYRGEAQEITVEAGGLVPDTDAMAAAGITWSNTQTQTIVQSADITNIGNVGDGNVRGFNPKDHKPSQIFDFGSELANRMVTITVDMEVKGSWDNNAKSTNDYFSVSANGKEIDVNFYSDQPRGWESSEVTQISSRGTNLTYTYEVYLDDKGQVQLDFMVASTADDEIVNVKNIQVIYEGQTGYVQEVTETETYTQSVLVDAAAEEVNASEISGGIPYVMYDKTVEVEVTPKMKEVTEVVGYSYVLNMSAMVNDASETLSDITFGNIPEGVTLQNANGEPITPNSDGSYSVSIDENGDTSVTLVSADVLSESEINGISASVTATESNGGASRSVSANIGDSVIEFDEADESIDGGNGFDTLLISGDQNIDFSLLSENISNIESINLGEGSQTITLNLEDVLEMTDAAHTLRIDGDSGDKINLDTLESGNDGEWKLGDNIQIDEQTYQQYTAGEGDRTVTLEISTNIIIEES